MHCMARALSACPIAIGAAVDDTYGPYHQLLNLWGLSIKPACKQGGGVLHLTRVPAERS